MSRSQPTVERPTQTSARRRRVLATPGAQSHPGPQRGRTHAAMAWRRSPTPDPRRRSRVPRGVPRPRTRACSAPRDRRHRCREIVRWGSAAPRAGVRPAAAGCSERTTRRSWAVTATRSTRLPQPWQRNGRRRLRRSGALSPKRKQARRPQHMNAIVRAMRAGGSRLAERSASGATLSTIPSGVKSGRARDRRCAAPDNASN